MPNKTLEKWEEKTLEEICEKISAGGDKPEIFSETKTIECNIPIYSNGIKDNGLYGYTNNPTIEKPAITISARGTIGFICKRLEPYCPIVRLISLIPKDFIDLSFLAYAMNFIIPKNTGTSIPQLTVPNLKTSKIQYPTLSEQQRIVGILDEAFENIEKAKQNALQNLNNAKELFENILNETFIPKTNVWKSEKLENICYKVQNRKNTKDINEKFLYVDIASINNKLNIIEDCKLCNGLEASSRARQIIQTNDILFSTVRTYLKNIAFVTKKYDKQIASTGFCVIRTNPNKLLGKFMFYKSLTKAFLEPLNELQTGASYPAIRDGDVFSQIIEYPPLEEQQKIVQQLDELQEQIKKLEQIYEQKIKDLDELKQSILQKAFNGEL